MIRAENYEKLNKFVKVTAKMLLVPFFGHGVCLYLALHVFLLKGAVLHGTGSPAYTYG